MVYGGSPLSFADVAAMLPLLDVLSPPQGVSPHVADDGAGFPLLVSSKDASQRGWRLPTLPNALENSMLDPLLAEVDPRIPCDELLSSSSLKDMD